VARRPLTIALGLALAALTAAVYAPSLDNGFVNYDDDLYILGDERVRSGLTGEGVVDAFTRPHGANWFPLTRLSWMLDAELFGISPRAFHATSLLLHIASALLLLLALVRMTGALPESVFVAGVFALHPLHVESVAWASARKDVVSGLFAMLVLLFYARATRLPVSRGARAGVFVCLGLGLMAKPTLVALPLALLLLDVWPLRRVVDVATARRALVEKLPLFGLAIATALITWIAQKDFGAVQGLERLSLGARLANALVSTVGYVGKALVPRDLAVFYPHPGDGLPVWQVAGAATLVAGVTLLAVLARTRRPHLFVGWFWYLVLLGPVIGIVQVGQAAMADRYTYLPLIGLGLAAAFSTSAWSPRARAAAGAAGALVLVALAWGTTSQVRTWRDDYSLYEHALRVTGPNHVVLINLAVALNGDRRFAEAEALLERALRIAPTSVPGRGAMGDALRGQDRLGEAVDSYRRALAVDPGVARWHARLGDALAAAGRPEDGLASYRAALQIDPDWPEGRANLALALAALSRFDEAITAYEEALRRRPDSAHVHGNLGVALARSGRRERAIEHFERALTLAPDLSTVHAQLGRALAQGGDVEGALVHLDAARRLESSVAAYHVYAAQLLERAGRAESAIDAYRAALAAGPRSVGALDRLARLLMTRDPQAALALAVEADALTGSRNPRILETLALAQAASGHPEDAARSSARAADLSARASPPP
jgi:tetratricopeptide (TPR) repeat protein